MSTDPAVVNYSGNVDQLVQSAMEVYTPKLVQPVLSVIFAGMMFIIFCAYFNIRRKGKDVAATMLRDIIKDVYNEDLERPPNNRLRKVVFKDGTGLDTSEKLSIVGSIIGRKRIQQEDIYDAMLHINEQGQNITISKLAKALKCTTRTIHRNMGEELKKEKDKLNIDNEKI